MIEQSVDDEGDVVISVELSAQFDTLFKDFDFPRSEFIRDSAALMTRGRKIGDEIGALERRLQSINPIDAGNIAMQEIGPRRAEIMRIDTEQYRLRMRDPRIGAFAASLESILNAGAQRFMTDKFTIALANEKGFSTSFVANFRVTEQLSRKLDSFSIATLSQ